MRQDAPHIARQMRTLLSELYNRMAEKTRLRNRIEDARGKLVSQFDPIKEHLLRRHGVIPADPLRELAEDIDRKWARWGHGIFLISAAGLALCWAGMAFYMLFVSTSKRFDLVVFLFYPVQFVVIFGGFLFGWMIAKQERFPRTRLAMLKHRRCPHCGYDLRGLAASPRENATACPECGCAWWLDDPAVVSYCAASARRASGPGKRARIVLVALALLMVAGLLAMSLMSGRLRRAARSRAVRPAPVVVRQAASAADRPDTGQAESVESQPTPSSADAGNAPTEPERP